MVFSYIKINTSVKNMYGSIISNWLFICIQRDWWEQKCEVVWLVIFWLFGLKTPLHLLTLGTLRAFYLCGFYLLIFLLLEVKPSDIKICIKSFKNNEPVTCLTETHLCVSHSSRKVAGSVCNSVARPSAFPQDNYHTWMCSRKKYCTCIPHFIM